MTQTQHTPGPWKAEYILTDDGKNEYCITHDNGNGFIVYGMPKPHTESSEFEANARLIAAAPDLLLVAHFLAELGEIAEVHHAVQSQVGLQPFQKARAAIAKVEKGD